LISKNLGITFIFYPPSGETARRKCRRRRQIRYGAGYWKKLELFTNKIRTLKFDLICPRLDWASASATLTWSKTEKFSTFIFFARIFNLKKRKFSVLRSCYRRKAETLTQAGKNSFPLHPFFFLPACLGFAQIFFSGRATNQKE